MVANSIHDVRVRRKPPCLRSLEAYGLNRYQNQLEHMRDLQGVIQGLRLTVLGRSHHEPSGGIEDDTELG